MTTDLKELAAVTALNNMMARGRADARRPACDRQRAYYLKPHVEANRLP